MLAIPVSTSISPYVAVVIRKNDPRRLSSFRLELDSIRLLNITVLRRSLEFRSGKRELGNTNQSTLESPLVAGAMQVTGAFLTNLDTEWLGWVPFLELCDQALHLPCHDKSEKLVSHALAHTIRLSRRSHGYKGSVAGRTEPF